MLDIMKDGKYVMLEKATGNFEVVTTLEKAYELLQAHTHLIGYLSFADLDTINAVIEAAR